MLRPPGVRAQGPPPDEAIYAALGARMAANNGYINQPSYALYDTTGTTEDWSYYATGGLGFTFEIGSECVPPARTRRRSPSTRAPARPPARATARAYVEALRNAADVTKHSRLDGPRARRRDS